MFFQIILCILIADFITGFMHWAEDTYGTLSDSWMSKNFWEPNILHHKYPSYIITMGNFFGRNYLQWAGAILFLCLIYPFFGFCWQIIFIAFIASFANETHAWSHAAKNHWLVELLQEMCILQTKLHHSKHHLKPYDRNYCILTNWLNPVLERLNFWKRLEYVLSPIIKVKRGSENRGGY